MVEMKMLESFFSSTEASIFGVKLLLAFILSLLLSGLAIPLILKISRRKNLMAIPGERSSHDIKVPNLGGVAIFYSIGVCAPIFAYELFETYKFLFPSLVMVLYIGIMDDILEIRAHKKLNVQIIVAVLLVIGSDIRIKNLFGLFEIYELPYIISILVSIFVFVIMINAFNLIDGIDGLAGVFAIVCCMIFGISYYRLGVYNYPMVVFCTIIIGSLIGFLYYNLSNRQEKKIFMGDTGSMIIGLLLVFTAFYFIDLFTYEDNMGVKYHLVSAPVITFAILILPIIDTLSVIIVRIINGKSPLKADKNHIHHKLLMLGLTHKQSTFYIIFYYIFIIFVTYFFRHVNINLLFFIVLSIGFFGAYLPSIIVKYRKNEIKVESDEKK